MTWETRIPEGEAAEALTLVGDKIRAARQAKDLTQQQLAALVGVHVSTIGRIENAKRYLRRSTLRDIVNALIPASDRATIFSQWETLATPGVVDESAYEARVRRRRERRQATGRHETVRDMQAMLTELDSSIRSASPEQRTKLAAVRDKIANNLEAFAKEHDLKLDSQQLGHSGVRARVARSGRDPADVRQHWQRSVGSMTPREELAQLVPAFVENRERELAALGPVAFAAVEEYIDRLSRFVNTGDDIGS